MERVIRFRIDEQVLRRYRAICAFVDISAPKQTEALIKHFVDIQEENYRKIREIKHE